MARYTGAKELTRLKAQPTADQLARHPPEYWEAVSYFEANRKKIAQKYGDDFVAILDGKVVDSDHDYGHLSSRVQHAFPGRHPYLAYAHPWSLAEWIKRYQIDQVDLEADRQAWEDDAAKDVIRRMDG